MTRLYHGSNVYLQRSSSEQQAIIDKVITW